MDKMSYHEFLYSLVHHQLITVEQVHHHSIPELVYYLYHRLNDVIEILCQTDEMIKNGLKEILKAWLDDGTLKDIITETLLNEVNLKSNHHGFFKKKILHDLPMKFPDWDDLCATYDEGYYYPSQFTIFDDVIYIIQIPESQKTPNIITCYDFKTGQYLKCFGAGVGVVEGLVVKQEHNKQYLYTKASDGIIGKYLIDTVANKEILQPIQTYPVNLYYDFSYHNGLFYVEQKGTNYGTGTFTRGLIYIYDEEFNRVGSLYLPMGVTGDWTGNYQSNIPKRQAFQVTSHGIYQATGGLYRKGEQPTGYAYQGVKILKPDGTLSEQYLCRPDLMIQQLEEKGHPCLRVEYEGITEYQSQIYSLIITQGVTGSNDYQSCGVLVVKENTTETGMIDFEPSGVHETHFNPYWIENGTMPRVGEELVNPLNGERLDSIESIFNFMYDVDLKSLCFYTTAISMKDIDGSTFPVGQYMRVTNVLSKYFVIETLGYNNVFQDWYYKDDNNQFIKHQIKPLLRDGLTSEEEIGIIPKNMTDFKGFYMQRNSGDSTYKGYQGLYKRGSETTLSHGLSLTKDGEEVNRLMVCEDSIQPLNDGVCHLGSSYYGFDRAYIKQVINPSDMNLKSNIQTIENALSFICQLNPVNFQWKTGDDKIHHGLIAQEIPVNENDGLVCDGQYLGVNYIELIPYLIKAIQELKEVIEDERNRSND